MQAVDRATVGGHQALSIMAADASSALAASAAVDDLVRALGARGLSKSGRKVLKRKLRRERLKQQQREGNGAGPAKAAATDATADGAATVTPDAADPVEEDVEIEYVQGDPAAEGDMAKPFLEIFQRFRALGGSKDDDVAGVAGVADGDAEREGRGSDAATLKSEEPAAGASDAGADGEGKPLSNRQRKALQRMTITALKQMCRSPEVVEIWDTTAPDPELLVHLKSYRNTVPVPSHWSQKRKFLQGKRGIEKPPFQLPAHIAATGIEGMRDNLQEKEEEMKLKQKSRDRLKPKMGKIDIDFQVLHDAFFRHQTKPPNISAFGAVYYEGKEFESENKAMRPGRLSPECMHALGMQPGGPPPWLVNMQRYGPPPAYPHLPVPGLNAPIPQGASFGYQPGGWGKPPVNEWGQPLYGNVFGVAGGGRGFPGGPGVGVGGGGGASDGIDTSFRWGAMESESEEESDQESDEGGMGDVIAGDDAMALAEDDADVDGVIDAADMDAMAATDLLAGGHDGEGQALNLRKDAAPSAADEEGAPPPALYRVLPEQRRDLAGSTAFMESAHTYGGLRDGSAGVGAGAGAGAGEAAGRARPAAAQEKKEKKKEKKFKF